MLSHNAARRTHKWRADVRERERECVNLTYNHTRTLKLGGEVELLVEDARLRLELAPARGAVLGGLVETDLAHDR